MEHTKHHPDTDPPSRDTIFTLLQSRRRREVVAALSDASSPIALQELATAVSTRVHGDGERAGAVRTDGSGSTDALVVALHHAHLPKLDAADVIDYDADRKAVTDFRIKPLTPCLRAVDEAR